MILEQRTYTLNPGNIAKYWKCYEELGAEIMQPVLPHLVGYFATEVGPLNRIVHLWRYEDLQERERLRGAMVDNPKWLSHLAAIRPLMSAQEAQILTPSPVPHLSPMANR